jgi:hypothetical protein
VGASFPSGHERPSLRGRPLGRVSGALPTTSSPEAAAAYREACGLLTSDPAAARALLDEALRHDPHCSLAKAAAALLDEPSTPAAMTSGGPLSWWERHHIEILDCAHRGDLVRAQALLADHRCSGHDPAAEKAVGRAGVESRHRGP